MRTTFTLFILLLFSVFAAAGRVSCLTSTGSGTFISGFYDLTVFDSNGTPIAAGWLQLDFKKGAEVSGCWKIFRLSGENQPAFPTGTGKLTGRLDEKNLSLNLNPGLVDDNLLHTGTANVGTIRGKWQWVTFAGLTNWGRFTAQK